MESLVLEYNSLIQLPIEGVSLEVGHDFHHWEGVLIGPPGTPFENGRFQYEIIFPSNYPLSAPEFYFKTKIFHPNVGRDGKICCSLIGSEWAPKTSLRSVFYGIFALLNLPNKENGFLNKAIEILIKSEAEFERKARKWTRKYAN